MGILNLSQTPFEGAVRVAHIATTPFSIEAPVISLPLETYLLSIVIYAKAVQSPLHSHCDFAKLALGIWQNITILQRTTASKLVQLFKKVATAQQ